MNWLYLLLGLGLLATLFQKSEKSSEMEEAEITREKSGLTPRPIRRPKDNQLHNRSDLNKPWGSSKYK